ncbi:hypothetical protein F4774DRAFT_409467 [Daldinia eschscholtzii]|nr:hypothetical protein F4774DRAFT_409467 [Daldinia eschscholtzii]
MTEITTSEGLPSKDGRISDSSVFKFLDLPPELRCEIYAHLFFKARPILGLTMWSGARIRAQGLAIKGTPDCCDKNYTCSHYDAQLRPLTSVLQTCRQVSEEALDVLYAQTVFQTTLENRRRVLRLFAVGEANLRRIRHLHLVVFTPVPDYTLEQPYEWFWPAALDAASWFPLLDGLQTLKLLIKAPIWADHAGWPVWVEKLETLVLKFLGEHVDERTELTIDDNYSVFLCDAVDRCFRKPFRRVSSEEGDEFYHKNRYDPDNIHGTRG